MLAAAAQQRESAEWTHTPPEPASLPTPRLQGVAEHRAELPALWSSSRSLAVLHTVVTKGGRQGEPSRGRVWFYTWWWRQQGRENTQEALEPRGEGAEGCWGMTGSGAGGSPQSMEARLLSAWSEGGSRALLSAWSEGESQALLSAWSEGGGGSGLCSQPGVKGSLRLCSQPRVTGGSRALFSAWSEGGGGPGLCSQPGVTGGSRALC